MASLPPLSHDVPDTFSASMATFRIKAMGNRKIKTRSTLLESSMRRSAYYEQDIMRAKFGPKTPLYAPMSLLGGVMSEAELKVLNERFSLTEHRQRSSSMLTSDVLERRRSILPFAEEAKEAVAAGGSELADFASRLKGSAPALLFCSKVLGEGYRPETREGGTLTTINRKLYLFGGRCRKLFNDVKVLDPSTLRWTESKLTSALGALPEPRVNHSAVCFGNKLVVYGGCERFNDILQIRNCFHLLHLFDTGKKQLDTLTWSSVKPSGRGPEPRRCHCAVVVGSVMFFYGGMDQVGKVLDDLQAVNLKALSHPAMDLFNPPKVYDEVFTPSTCGVYMFGGLNEKGMACNDVYVLKAKKMSVRDDRPSLIWVKPDLSGTPPEPRYDHCACLCGKSIFIYGGRDDSLFRSQSHCEIRSFAVLNIESQRWERAEVLGAAPSGRWGLTMATLDSRIFIFGGMKLSKFCSSKLNIIETDKGVVQDRAAGLTSVKKKPHKLTVVRPTRGSLLIKK